MAVASTTVKKPSENSPIKRARPWRCERKQTPKNRVRATKGKSWEKTVESRRPLGGWLAGCDLCAARKSSRGYYGAALRQALVFRR